MKKAVALLLAAVLSIGMFAACKKEDTPPPEDTPEVTTPVPDNSPDPSTPPPVEPAKETYFNHYLDDDVTTLDPCLTDNGTDGNVLINILEPLTRYTVQADGTYEFEPAGAKSWSSNADETEWTFILNDNFWEDGQPVTAYDYEYAIRRNCDPEVDAYLGWQLDCLKNYYALWDGDVGLDELGVEAVDDKTLVITLEETTPYFFQLTAIQVMLPQRQDIVELYGEQFGSDVDYFLSCGPFKIDSWTAESVVLLKNENYWDAANVALDRVNLAFILEGATIMAAFENGEIDQVAANSAEWRDRFLAMDGAEYHPVDDNGPSTYYFFNTKDDLFQNEKIRKAFIVALDRDELCELVYTGTSIPNYGWIPPTMTVGDDNYSEKAGFPVKDLIAEYPDPKALLLEGMAELGLGDDPSKLDVLFKFSSGSQLTHSIAEYIQQNFKEVLGVEIAIDFGEWTTFSASVKSGDFQMAQMGWGAYYNDPIDLLSLFRSDWDSINTGWASDEFDDLIRQASSETNDAKRLDLYIQAERLIFDAGVVCPVRCLTYQYFVRDYVQGARFGTFSDNSYKLYDTSARP